MSITRRHMLLILPAAAIAWKYVFIFSAMVSGIAVVMLLYMLLSWARKETIDMCCVDTVARYLFYAFIIDFSLEMLDLIHRIYEADESFRSLDFMVHTKLYMSHIVVRIILGTVTPIALLALTQVLKSRRNGPQAHLRPGGMPDPGRNLCHALERRDRRPVVFQEFSGIYDLQDGFGHARRTVRGHCADYFAIAYFVGAGEASASLAGDGFRLVSGCRTRPLISKRKF